ncbi:hypothetical protein GUJ93_ZPchr0003g16643 [Zizania palustris]|uniref:Uncharacterized protein n=1 Tax=Zizania palustris TaxID=103762 RepID=A0A8J5VE96_ZIZPA|nr:hypothetical protein GUJ93_ZPchr0003g16643 [Zizania palustris]
MNHLDPTTHRAPVPMTPTIGANHCPLSLSRLLPLWATLVCTADEVGATLNRFPPPLVFIHLPPPRVPPVESWCAPVFLDTLRTTTLTS